MKIKTSELTGPALDWAVAKCRGFDGIDEDQWLLRCGIADMPLSAYTPSTDWSQGGPIIERERLDINYDPGEKMWTAHWFGDVEYNVSWGDTPLIAACRCFVASKLGNEVDVPEELAQAPA